MRKLRRIDSDLQELLAKQKQKKFFPYAFLQPKNMRARGGLTAQKEQNRILAKKWLNSGI